MTKKEYLVIGGAVGIFLLARMMSAKADIASVESVNHNSAATDWFADMYARLNGADLSIDGENPSPGGLDAYGMSNEMGWNYQWFDATNPLRA